MSSDASRRYYEKNRDKILERMRTRDTERREERRQHLLTNPDDADLEREKMRGKYHNGVANKCKRQMEAWIDNPLVPEEAKRFFRYLLADDKYKGLKPRALHLMCEPLNINASLL